VVRSGEDEDAVTAVKLPIGHRGFVKRTMMRRHVGARRPLHSR
jgi:hypothetical protein